MKQQNLIEQIMNDPKPLPRKVPDYMRKRGGIWYWTGAMVMIVFFYEVITGVILFLYYQPSNAYVSTESVLSVPYGSIILTTHLYGAYLMIALVYLHLLRNLFVGAYKQPRQMQWLTGVALLLLTVAVSYFGYSMTGDVLSSDATDVARGIAGGFPIIGKFLSLIFLGNGSDISLFTRFEGWHIILAGSILALFAAHFFLAEYNTIMPAPEKVGYRVPAIDKEDSTYSPWYPNNLFYMTQIALFTLALIFLIPSIIAIIPGVPALFSPFPQVAASSPLASAVPPYPPWFLLFIYKELDFGISATVGPFWATVIFTGAPLIYLLLVPYIEKSTTLKPSRRPIVVSTGIVGIIYLVGLSAWGALLPGVPVSNIVGLLFFVIPLALIIPTVSYISKAIESGKIRMKSAWKVFVLIAFDAFISILDGISIYSSLGNGSFYHTFATIFLTVVLAVSLLVTFAMIYGIKVEEKTRVTSGRVHVVFGSIYGILAVAILAIISVIPPDSTFNQSLYGIGMGLIFLLGGVFTMLYRSHEFNE
jgi:quinol-cytochrome oxidoreductase complex cytochrome b subunit